MSAVLLQSFLVRRASMMFNSNLTAQTVFVAGFHLVIAVAFLAQTGALAIGVLLAHDSEADFHGFTLNLLNGVWLWLSTFVDCSLSIALYVLLRRRLEGSVQGLRSVVRVAFQTALLTSVLSLAGAVCAVAWSEEDAMTSAINISFSLPLASLYALSLIVTLASRRQRVAVVVGKTLAGSRQRPIVDGLAGAGVGEMVGMSWPGMGRESSPATLVAEGKGGEGREGDSDSDDDDDDDDDDEGSDEEDKKGTEYAVRGRGEWRHLEKEGDVELGPAVGADGGGLWRRAAGEGAVDAARVGGPATGVYDSERGPAEVAGLEAAHLHRKT